jgi:hypothetical protein
MKKIIENINSDEALQCPKCYEDFPEIKQRGKTPLHFIFDTGKKCTGTNEELVVRKVEPGEVVKRSPMLIHGKLVPRS